MNISDRSPVPHVVPFPFPFGVLKVPVLGDIPACAEIAETLNNLGRMPCPDGKEVGGRFMNVRSTQWVKIAALAAAATAISSASFAQSHPEYFPLRQVSAVLYKPDSGPAPHVAFVIAHRTGNYLNHIGCHELSARGFMVVCFNTRYQNNEAAVRWEETPLDVKAAVDFARSQPGITKVILFGHSGGGPLMSFYQAVAEKGYGVLPSAKQASEMRQRFERPQACRRRGPG